MLVWLAMLGHSLCHAGRPPIPSLHAGPCRPGPSLSDPRMVNNIPNGGIDAKAARRRRGPFPSAMSRSPCAQCPVHGFRGASETNIAIMDIQYDI